MSGSLPLFFPLLSAFPSPTTLSLPPLRPRPPPRGVGGGVAGECGCVCVCVGGCVCARA